MELKQIALKLLANQAQGSCAEHNTAWQWRWPANSPKVAGAAEHRARSWEQSVSAESGRTRRRCRLEPASKARHHAHGRQAAVVQQRVDERTARVAGRWVHHQACLLVDDQQVRVLVHDLQQDRLAVYRKWHLAALLASSQCG